MCYNSSLSLASRARSQVLDLEEEYTALTPLALKHAALATASPQTYWAVSLSNKIHYCSLLDCFRSVI